jgi:hypothetical protein
VQLRKLIERRIRAVGSGVDLAADVKAAVAGNFGERGQTTTVSSRSDAVSTTVKREERRNGEEQNRAESR